MLVAIANVILFLMALLCGVEFVVHTRFKKRITRKGLNDLSWIANAAILMWLMNG